MADPFAAALAVLHGSVVAAAAVYRPPAGDPVSCRVIVDRQSADADVGGRSLRLEAMVVLIQKVDVALPVVGGFVDLVDPVDLETVLETHRIVAPPQLDVEGVTWACEVPAVA
jgi:hypothetical protein